MAERQPETSNGMSAEEYERLVLLAAKRRRGEACDELEGWLRADPAAAEMVEALDDAAQELDRQIEATAPSAEHRASQRAALLAEVERRRRTRRLRWAGVLAAAAALVIAVPLLWRPAVVGRATVRALSDASQSREFDVRSGQAVRAEPATRVRIELGDGREIELEPEAAVSVYDHRVTVLDGKITGSSGSVEMRIDFADWSLRLAQSTEIVLELSDKECRLWTDREARLMHGSTERVLKGGETTTLDLGKQTEQ